MPIYEYQCKACEHKMEALHKISDEPLKDCPECGKDTLSKMVSAAGFRLSGSGWYETDFKTGDKKNLSTKDKKPDSGSDSKSSTSGSKDSTSTSSSTSSSSESS
ncbi:MAG: zinc ribbon domain-containing protein [Pseudomonadales bacterium]